MKTTGSNLCAIMARSRVRMLAGASAGAMCLTALAALGPGGTAAQAAAPYPTPAITVAGGNSVIAVQTSEDGLRFYWNQYGTNTWRGEQVAANGTTYSPPTIVQDGNAVIIAAQGPNDSLDFYWQQIGASGWNAETVAGARSTYSAPSMGVDGNTVNIAAEGPNNSLTFYWAVNGSPTWGPETVAGPGTTYSAPSLAVNGGGINIAAEGPSNSLDFYWALNGTSTWGPEVVAGAGTTFSPPAITGNDGSANIAAEGSGNLLDFYWQVNGTTPWNLVYVPYGQVYGPPAITPFVYDGTTDEVHIVAPSLLNGLTDYAAADGSDIWQALGVDGLGIAGSAATVTENNGSENIAVFAPSGELDFYWTNSTGAYQKEVVAAAGVN
jgi:hypothetical protein